MPETNSFLRSPKPVLAAVIVLLVQIALFYGMPRQEKLPPSPGLAALMPNFGGWRMTHEGTIEKEIQDILKADETLTRGYTDPSSQRQVNLFVAFFRSQRAGASPHSPKVCLPGSGWVPTNSATASLEVPGWNGPININRYTVARGEHKSVVLYWYQSHNRIVANEYAAKMYLILDSMRYRRSDTSIVRVTVPVLPGEDETHAQAAGEEFIRSFFAPLRAHLSGSDQRPAG